MKFWGNWIGELKKLIVTRKKKKKRMKCFQEKKEAIQDLMDGAIITKIKVKMIMIILRI